MKWWLRAAIFCGAAPMTVGVGVFLVWLAVGASWLPVVGLVTLSVGPVVVAAGTACLLIYVVARCKVSQEPRGRGWWLGQVGVLGLLLANFPVAAAVLKAALPFETEYLVTIHNTSPIVAQSVTVTGGGVEIDFGDIPAGEWARQGFHIRHDGQLTLAAVLADQPVEAVIDEYVTNGLGANKLVTIGPGGKVSVVDHGER